MYLSLSERDKRFADEYVISLNAKEAALKAGFAKSTAEKNAAEWLNPESERVKTGVLEYIEKKLEEIELNKTMEAKEVIERLSKIGRREEYEYVVVTVREKKVYYDENGKRCSIETEEPISVPIPAKLSDTNKALELIGKYHALFTDKSDVSLNSLPILISGSEELED